ncbi:hypothetical protein P3X46_009084 [Hevea brasiliensis]|uniref:Uncharacterized protein n=1 Tax=Hevea brasiliensis TaxID=3981 RepID=A0ABQ9MN83_HEVBR|nr:hypothetical protein P3X46_009084 [Hevea brasiliensis]
MGEVKSRVAEKRAEKKRSEKKLSENVVSEQDKDGYEERKESTEKIPRLLEKGESSMQKESCAERGERKLNLYVKGKDEYEDVLSEEMLAGLPPIQGIEHQIDFVPRAGGQQNYCKVSPPYT